MAHNMLDRRGRCERWLPGSCVAAPEGSMRVLTTWLRGGMIVMSGKESNQRGCLAKNPAIGD